MSKLTKYLFLLSFLFIAFGQTKAHSVQVGYCVNCAGDLRIWVEHWHNAANPNTTTMTIQVQVGPQTININGSPDTSVLGVPIGQLPGCFTPLNVFAQCQGTGIYQPNTHNDWVAYDFPGLQCGVPINITVISGNSAFTQDCGNPVNMFPASSGQFTIPCSTNQLPDDTICAGEQAGPYNFPVGNTWTNDNPAIGLAANGTGDVGPFTSANVTVPTTGNITVNNTCGIETFAMVSSQPVSMTSVNFFLELLMSQMGEDILRIKGILNIKGENRPAVIHGVQHIFHPLEWLEKWPGDDKKSRLVFITKNINKNTIDDLFKIIGENELNKS